MTRPVEWSMVDGHKVARLVGRNIAAAVDIDRGAHIFELVDSDSGLNVLYRDPRGLAHHVVGGWYLLFPNAGPGCGFRGISIPRHGDVRDLPWEVVSATNEGGRPTLGLRVTAGCLPLGLERAIILVDAEDRLEVRDTAVNLADTPLPYLLGHHITLGSPFVDGARVMVASTDIISRSQYAGSVSRVRPTEVGASLDRLPGFGVETVDLSIFPSAPAAEMLFARTLTSPVFEVQGADGLTLSARWDALAFPSLWIWMENRGTQSEPFQGTCTGMALEPQSSHLPSLAASVAANLAPVLAPGERRTSWVTVSLKRRALEESVPEQPGA